MQYHYLSDMQILAVIWFSCLAGLVAAVVFAFIYVSVLALYHAFRKK